MTFPFVQSLHYFKPFLSPNDSAWRLPWVFRIDSHKHVGVPLPKNSKGSTTLAELVLEPGKSMPYLAGRWINVVLQEQEGVSHELFLLPENFVHAREFGAGIGRLLCRQGSLAGLWQKV
jgi:hypothetical protein